MGKAFIVLLFALTVWGAIKASQPSPIQLAESIRIPVELTGK